MSTKITTGRELADRCLDVAKNHKTLYVMGCFGAPLTGKNVSRYCNNHKYNTDPSRTAMIKAAANQNPPVYGFDCVCLIKGLLWGWNADPSKTYGGAQYAINGVPDVSANGMIAKCKDVSTKGWTDMAVGEALWCEGHIGIYIGDGLGVECTPRWANKVQVTAVGNIGAKKGYNTRMWTKHGKLPYVSYSDPVNDAITKLGKLGVINSPDYWKSAVSSGKIKYLGDLFVKTAAKITKKGTPASTYETAVQQLVSAGIMNSPDYWLGMKTADRWMEDLMKVLAGAVRAS